MTKQTPLPLKYFPLTPPQDVRKHTAEVETTEKETIVKNPSVKNKINPILSGIGSNPIDYSGLLVLSNNSTFQQLSDKEKRKIKHNIKQKKIENRGKLFMMKTEPTYFCNSTRSAIAKVESGNIKEILFNTIPCRSWSCPVCSIKKALSLRILLTKIAQLNNLTYFITLTLDPKKLTYEEKQDTHAYITKKFNHFKTVLKRKKFKYYDPRLKRTFTFDLSKREELKYEWIIEFQKNGNAHMHILCNQFLPVIVLRKVWQDVGGGHRIDIQNVRSIERVSNYISGYLIKGIKENDLNVSRGYGFRYGQRRYSVSRTCERPKQDIVRAFDKADFETKKKILINQGLEWIVTELEKEDGDILKVVFND